MADSAIVKALLGDTDALMAANPYYTAGAGLAKSNLSQYVAPDDFWGSLLTPIGQGLASGYLMGKGKSDVSEQVKPAYRDFFNTYAPNQPNPVDAEDWSVFAPNNAPAITKALMGMEAAKDTKQTENEALKAIALQLIKDKKDATSVLEALSPGLGKKVAQGGAGKQDKVNIFEVDGLVPNTDKEAMAGATGTLKKMELLANKFDAYGDKANTFQYQIGKNIARTDAGKLQQELILTGAEVAKLAQGARPSDYDSKTLLKVVAGDLSVAPSDVSKLIRQVTKSIAEQQMGKLQGYEQMVEGQDAIRAGLQPYLGEQTGAGAVSVPQALQKPTTFGNGRPDARSYSSKEQWKADVAAWEASNGK